MRGEPFSSRAKGRQPRPQKEEAEKEPRPMRKREEKQLKPQKGERKWPRI